MSNDAVVSKYDSWCSPPQKINIFIIPGIYIYILHKIDLTKICNVTATQLKSISLCFVNISFQIRPLVFFTSVALLHSIPLQCKCDTQRSLLRYPLLLRTLVAAKYTELTLSYGSEILPSNSDNITRQKLISEYCRYLGPFISYNCIINTDKISGECRMSRQRVNFNLDRVMRMYLGIPKHRYEDNIKMHLIQTDLRTWTGQVAQEKKKSILIL